ERQPIERNFDPWAHCVSGAFEIHQIPQDDENIFGLASVEDEVEHRIPETLENADPNRAADLTMKAATPDTLPQKPVWSMEQHLTLSRSSLQDTGTSRLGSSAEQLAGID